MPTPTLQQLLKTMLDQRASDLHVTVNTPPQLRIDGQLVRLRTEPLEPVDVKQICYEALDPQQKMRFEEELELDLSFSIKNLARFRANLFMQQGAMAGVFRVIPFKIPPLGELGLPKSVEELLNRPQGMILVTGPTGSGKSTTLASMIDYLNQTRRSHIVTIEDPIEFVHEHKRCLINQREVGQDTRSFKGALKSVLRQDPDIVLVGEMRNLETIEAALTLGETGHLCMATLHTNSAAQSINRIIDVFPPHQQPQVRAVLSMVLQGVISQTLLPRAGEPGRAMAAEVMIPNPAIRNLIREDKTHQIYSTMQIGQSKFGMQTMNQALCTLFIRRQVTLEDAMGRSPDVEELKTLISAAQSGPGGAPPPRRGR
ncbi:type IV pilus twitching motility protein PilT [Haliangium sp.]|uniref:type IV pilus twitching motility protein PilT n=1 Tax=Haliangium sp. TaxID=2663208 RepID=UPI003D0DA1CD